MMEDLAYISENYFRINQRIQAACEKFDRQPEDVHLVVVTKLQPIEKIIKVCEIGAKLLGENYPEETAKKVTELTGLVNPEWHMIGHIQSRKIKYLVKHFSFIHSIDRIEIAEKLNRACLEQNRLMPILLEINLTGEESKSGFRVTTVNEAEVFIEGVKKILELEHLLLQGLMTMPPLVNQPEANRSVFRNLKILSDHVQNKTSLDRLPYLSMGTSQDFEIAIQEGATHIRIGEAIMGKRSRTEAL